MSQYIVHSINTKPRPQHEGYYSPSLGAHELEFSNTYSLATINGHSIIYLKFRGKYDKTLKGLTVSISLPVTYTDAKQKIKKDLQKTSYYIPEKDISLAATYAEDVSNQLSHSSDEPDVIDCTSNQDNEPDYLSVKMSDIDDLDDNYLKHHGVKGMKWGVINQKPTDPRQRTSRTNQGHPYYSPNTGNSSNTTNSVIKRNTNPGKNTSTSTKKTYYTADLSQKPLSDKDGVHYVIGMGNSGYGAQISIPSYVITSTLDRNEDLAAMVKNHVIQAINDFRTNSHYGEQYKNLYLTDKQIDSIVWSLVYKIEKDWKKNYYKPGQF